MNSDIRTRDAIRVSWIGFFVNLILCFFKLFAGIFGKSTAMLADAIHSISDFVTDLIVIVFVSISAKQRDATHDYGHGKFETFASLLVSAILLAVGIGILINGINKVSYVIKGKSIAAPGMIAFIAAIVSIITKESLYWYTIKIGKKTNNQAVIANAWHHRSDALSSVGTALGIGGAIFLGEKAHILDPITGILVSGFIIWAALKILLPAINELLESSLPENLENEIVDIIKSHPDVKDCHNLKTRKIGNIYAIDVHVKLDKNITFVHSHDVASEIESKIRNKFGKETIINIHTEPI